MNKQTNKTPSQEQQFITIWKTVLMIPFSTSWLIHLRIIYKNEMQYTQTFIICSDYSEVV